MGQWFKDNIERLFLIIVSVMFLAFCVLFLSKSQVAAAASTFVMFFLCLIYSNVARFRRFKGLGFEAELWEDKQKEAAQLIDRLQDIVAVYTREIVMGRVSSGRLGGFRWQDHWALYDELVGKHTTLGQKIDFSKLKEHVYRMMVADAVYLNSRELLARLGFARGQANEKIRTEFGDPIQDSVGYSKRQEQLSMIPHRFADLYEISEKENVARYVLDLVHRAQQQFLIDFGIQLDLPKEEMERLNIIDRMFKAGDFAPNDELISLANFVE